MPAATNMFLLANHLPRVLFDRPAHHRDIIWLLPDNGVNILMGQRTKHCRLLMLRSDCLLSLIPSLWYWWPHAHVQRQFLELLLAQANVNSSVPWTLFTIYLKCLKSQGCATCGANQRQHFDCEPLWAHCQRSRVCEGGAQKTPAEHSCSLSNHA
jgi:hypothetical protein